MRWLNDESTDIAHVLVTRSVPVVLDSANCGIVWESIVVEPIKGTLAKDQRIRVLGPGNPDDWQMGERLMFLGDMSAEPDDACSEHLFTSYKSLQWSCCEIRRTEGHLYVQFITMINSEMRGKDVPVPAVKVFDLLRSWN